MSSFRDGHARICKRDFWPIIPLSFKQILNLCFNMADIYCTSKVFCLTFVTTTTNFSHRRFWGLKFVWNYDKWPNLNWCTSDLFTSSFIRDSSVTTFSFIWSEYWLILLKPFSDEDNGQKKCQKRVVHCLLLLLIWRYWFLDSLHLL